MQYVDFRSLLYSDTLVPDVFINEYMPALKSEYVKIYLYCLFLAGKNRNPAVSDLSRVLDIPLETVKKGLHFMSNLNIISWTEDGVVIRDLKEIEINKFYRPKSTSSPEEAIASGKAHLRRNQVIDAINNDCFSGVMSISWYVDIDLWFNQYGFEEDVMYMLFRHCRDSGSLIKPYVAKVAENMHSKGVINSFDFDMYIKEYEEIKTVGAQIQKKLKLRRRLDVYQEEYVDRWLYKYGYSFDIIEMALRKTTIRPEASFVFFDSVLKRWHDLGLDSAEKIAAHEKEFLEGYAGASKRAGGEAAGASSAGRGRAKSIGGFTQRKYDSESLDRFVTNEFGISEAENDEGRTGGDRVNNDRIDNDRAENDHVDNERVDNDRAGGNRGGDTQSAGGGMETADDGGDDPGAKRE
jgi:DnaD/phage-associated family protein